MRELTCIVCPRGCKLKIEGVDDQNVHAKLSEDDLKVSGYACPRGNIYARSEVVAPVRMVTATITVENADSYIRRCPVKTSKPVPKAKMVAVVKAIKQATIKLPIKLHQVVIKNVAETGVDVITTRSLG